MTTDREAFLASFKEYLATTPAVELLNDSILFVDIHQSQPLR